MHYFSSGATGFLGSHLCVELLRNPLNHLAVLVRADSPLQGRQRMGVALGAALNDQGDTASPASWLQRITVSPAP